MNTCPAPPASPVDARARKHGYACIRRRRRASAYSGHIHVEHLPRPVDARAARMHACAHSGSAHGRGSARRRAAHPMRASARARAQTEVRVSGSAGIHARTRGARDGGPALCLGLVILYIDVCNRSTTVSHTRVCVSNRSTTYQYIFCSCVHTRARNRARGAPCTSPSTRCPTPCVSGRRAAAPAPRARQQGRSEQLVSETERSIRGRHGEENPRARQERTTLQGGGPLRRPPGRRLARARGCTT